MHSEQVADLRAIAQGVFSAVRMFEQLQKHGLVGSQLEPPFPVTPANKDLLVEWIRDNHWTVFHWACTCKAGIRGDVADEKFRVRSVVSPSSSVQPAKTGTPSAAAHILSAGSSPSTTAPGESAGVIRGLRVGSAASLPDMPDANPHLTVTAFAVALAEELLLSLHAQADADADANYGARSTGKEGVRMPVRDGSLQTAELVQARSDILLAIQQQQQQRQKSHEKSNRSTGVAEQVHAGEVVRLRRPGQEWPPSAGIAARYNAAWRKAHPGDSDQ